MARGLRANTKGRGNRQDNRRQSYQMRVDYSYYDCMIRDVRELEEAMNQRNRHQQPSTQVTLDGNMKTLLRHLEEGEVIYKAEMTVPSSLVNRQPSNLIILRTTLKSQESSWIVRHEPNESHIWEVNYSCRESAFGAFRICSCDRVTAVR